MPSAAEQLAANFNFRLLQGAGTAAAHPVHGSGADSRQPGHLHSDAGHRRGRTRAPDQQQQGSLLDVFNLLAGGAVGRMAIFALGIMPYISSSIIIQLMTTVSPKLESQERGEAGSRSTSTPDMAP